MKPWRREILHELVTEGWISSGDAGELDVLEIDDESFIAAVVEAMARQHPSAAFLARLALEAPAHESPSLGSPAPSNTSIASGFHEIPSAIGNRYQFKRVVDQGGMGVVYEALDAKLNRPVAIKLAKNSQLAPKYAKRLEREWKTLSDLNDPSIVAVYDVGTLANGQPFFVMPFVEGIDLATFVSRHQCRPRDVLRLMTDVAHAVGVAHRKGIIHRDLKPNNVLVTPGGRPVVIDFGLAFPVPTSEVNEGGTETSPKKTTRTGTQGYIAPEQASGEILTSSCDVYSLGVMLHELLTGDKPVSPRDVSSKLSFELGAVVRRCLECDPTRRYFTGSDLAKDLRSLQHDEPIDAIREGRRLYVARKFLSRNRWTLGPLSLVTFVLGLALTITFAALNRQRIVASQERDGAVSARRNEEELRRRREYEILFHRVATARDLLRQQRRAEAERSIRDIPATVRGWECDRLLLESQLRPDSSLVIGAHDWGVTAMGFRSAREIVSAGHDGRITVSGTDGLHERELVLGAWSNDHRFWKHAQIAFPQPETPSSARECWSSVRVLPGRDDLLAGSLSGSIYVINMASGEKRLVHRHVRPITVLEVTPEGTLALAGDDEGRVITMRSDGTLVHSIATEAGGIRDIVPIDAETWCVGTANGVLGAIDVGQGRVTHRWDEARPIWGMDKSVEGRLAVASARPIVSVLRFSKDTGFSHERDYVMPPDKLSASSEIHRVRWSPDGSQLAAGDNLGRLVIWDLEGQTTALIDAEQREAMLPGTARTRLSFPLTRRCSEIAFEPSGKALWTSGQDATIKRWNIAPKLETETLTVASNPRIAFNAEGNLWVGGSDGSLVLHDLSNGTILQSIQAHPVNIRSLSVAAEHAVVATASARSIRIWSTDEESTLPLAVEITTKEPVRHVVLSPTGDRVAATLTNNHVFLWEVNSKRLLATLDLSPGNAMSGIIKFNATGDKIAIGGAGQSCLIVDGKSLRILERPYLFSGSGGTALDWHPTDPKRLAGGDTSGRIANHPETRNIENTSRHLHNQPVIGLEWTPDGKRFIAASAEGQVAVVEPFWWGSIHEFTAASTARLTGIAIGPRQSELVLAHENGRLEIWKTVTTMHADATTTRHWRQRDLLFFPGGHWLSSRVPAVGSAAQDEIVMVYLRSNPVREWEKAERFLSIANFSPDRFSTRDIVSLGTLDSRTSQTIGRSVALAIDSNHVWVAHRQPRPDLGPSMGEIHLRRIDLDVLRSPFKGSRTDKNLHDDGLVEIIPSPGNHGFDLTLLPNAGGRPDMLHFSHAGHFLLRTDWIGSEWRTTKLGRQGDGYHLAARRLDPRRLAIGFTPVRYNGDPLPGVCLTFDPSDPDKATRIRLSHRPFDQMKAVTVGMDGSLVFLVGNSKPFGQNENQLVRVRGDETTMIQRIPTDELAETLSNVVGTDENQFQVAIFDVLKRKLFLATVTTGSVTRELVADFGPENDKPDEDETWVGPYLMRTSDGCTNVFLGRNSQSDSWLRQWHMQRP